MIFWLVIKIYATNNQRANVPVYSNTAASFVEWKIIFIDIIVLFPTTPLLLWFQEDKHLQQFLVKDWFCQCKVYSKHQIFPFSTAQETYGYLWLEPGTLKLNYTGHAH